MGIAYNLIDSSFGPYQNKRDRQRNIALHANIEEAFD